MCIALFTLTPIWPHQSRFSNAQRTPLMTGSRGGVGPCPCTSCSHSSSSRPSSPCSATRLSSGSSGDLSGSHCFYQSHNLFDISMLFRDVQNLTGAGVSRCGSSGTIRCHHFILHQDRELSVRSHEPWQLMGDNLVNIFCSFSTPSDSHVDSGQQRQAERDTRHGGRESLQMTSLKNSENSSKFCSCKQFR